MAKNDFDIDFDFEKEYGFDPKAILDTDTSEEDLDLSQFDDEQLSMDLPSDDDNFLDFDLDALDEEVSEPETPVPQVPVAADNEPVFEEYEEDLDFDEAEEEDEDFDDFEEEEELMDFSRRASFFDTPAEETPAEEIPAENADMPLAPVYDDPDEDDGDLYDDDLDDDDDDLDDEDDPQPRKREHRGAKKEPVKFTMPEFKMPELTVPPFLMKLYKLYFPSMEEIDPKPDPNGPRRRRKSKLQVFKEAYLPAILAGISLLLVVVFVFGSLGNAIQRKQQNDAAAKLESQAAANQQAQAEQRARQAIAEAERLAAGYDYEAAITLLESVEGTVESTDLAAKKAEYTAAQSKLVEHKDLSTVPNLSFHVLIHDLNRALSDTDDLAGQYNRNFVSTQEFSKILDQLYKNNYVLVDMDSFVGSNTGVDGTPTFFPQTVYLPEGKKPVMITETMVNYFGYMIDGDNNGVADAGGDGFASRLILDNNGDIKAEYVDANGQTQVGDYDLVPILESFIKAHPDFCYRGARATLAVCGYEGVFGYRVNNTYVPTMGQTYVDEQIALAKDLVATLREKGYTIACYTYENIPYGEKNVTQIQADMQQWAAQITPILGEVDTLIFARTSDIGDYSGPKFEMLTSCGIRYFIKHGEDPYAEVNNSYVRQTRLMVTGNTMAWKASMFTDDGLFDPITVLDPARGNVPN